LTTLPSATPDNGPAGSDAFIADLPDRAVLRIEGADAVAFLAGQLTSDVRALAPLHSQLTAWCNAKGRVIAVGQLMRRAREHLLLVPDDLAEEVLTRLGRYVLRAEVALTDGRPHLAIAACAGPRAGEVLRARLGRLPEPPDGLIEHSGCVIVDAGCGYLVLGEAEPMRALRQGLALAEAPAARWRLLEIGHGIPVIRRATSEAYLPQMLNLEALGGLSFQKGCYPGQEVIARLEYRGELKRRMFQASAAADEPPPAGHPLVRAAAGAAERVGEVLCAEREAEGQIALLAVIHVAAAGSDLYLGDPGGPLLSLKPFAYTP
jgi:folate-binding protein YgfZ